jgi:hypothetical protein
MSKSEDKYVTAREAHMFGAISTPTQGQEMVKLAGGELICCPLCDGSKLTMRAWELRNGLIMEYSGMFADYHCRDCDKIMTLGFFNQPLGEGEIAARIHWVVKDEYE